MGLKDRISKAGSGKAAAQATGRPRTAKADQRPYRVQSQLPADVGAFLADEVHRLRLAAKTDPALRIGSTGKAGRLPDAGDVLAAALLHWQKLPEAKRKLPQG